MSVDTIYIACQIVVGLQGFLTRRFDQMSATVLTVGSIHSGTANNIIPETATLEITLRTTNEDIRSQIHQAIPEFADKTAQLFGGSATTNVVIGYNVGFNDAGLHKLVKATVLDLYGEDAFIKTDAILAAEDFYDFSISGKVPVSMFRLGVGNDEKGIIHPNHSAYFDADEDALPIGVAVLTGCALRFLNNEQ
ncbi:MAG: M20/M25/M40 family metallo-hydrolase [Candidatus Heimdallarchaeota archaeon]|nr:M20/M25/M40 family metallo-hydrolase [Candidatus Heimdallarchaeota archaeon]